MGGEVREGGFTVALTHSLRRRVSYQRLVILEQMRTIMTSLLTRNATPRRIQLYTMWREVHRESRKQTLIHPPSPIVLPLTSRKTMPGTSLRVLCRFSNDLRHWRIVPDVSRNCVLITNASDRVIIFQRESSGEKLASLRNRDTLLRAFLIERVISARVAPGFKAERISTLDVIARRKATWSLCSKL